MGVQKLCRLRQEIHSEKSTMQGAQQQVADESIEDTLLDLANYAIMELVEREAEKEMDNGR